MAISGLFFLVLLPLSCASVTRNGMKLAVLPIPGIYKNGSIIVNSKSERNDIDGDQVQEVHTVNVKTPAATFTFSNASQYRKSVVEQVENSLGDEISALKHLDPSELIDLDVPVQVNDLLELGKSASPVNFREKIYGSKMMEKLIDTLQQKSVELYSLKNELESVAGSHKIVKRESTWGAPNMLQGVWKPIPYTRQSQWWPVAEDQSVQWWPEIVPSQESVDEMQRSTEVIIFFHF